MRKCNEPIRPCDVETPEDLVTYYRGCVVGVPDPSSGTTIPYTVNAADRNGIIILPAVTGKGKTQAIPFRDFRKNVSFSRPDLGMVNVGPTAVYTYTSAERRAEKGYRPEHIHIHGFNTWALRNVNREFANLSGGSSTLLWSLFNKEFYEPAEACKALSSGERVGCAISQHVSLYTTEDCPTILIGYKTAVAGFISSRDTPHLGPEFIFAKRMFERTLGQEVMIQS